MKKLYTLALVVFTIVCFGQTPDNVSSAKQQYWPNKGLWAQVSYGYNMRSFMPDYLQLSSTPGIYQPRAYLAGQMPVATLGYMVKNTLGFHASFNKPIANTAPHKDTFVNGSVQAKGWYTSAGVDLYPFPYSKLSPFAKLGVNVGSFAIQTKFANNNGLSGYNTIVRGGIAIGGSAEVGAQYPVFKNAALVAAINFTHLLYKPKEFYNVGTGVIQTYGTNQSDGIDPNFGYVYVSQTPLQEYIRMNFISFSLGFKFYLFTK
jgi:hypothetical protein